MPSHNRFHSLIPTLAALALVPALASGQPRYPNGDTESRVTRADDEPINIEMHAATTQGEGSKLGVIQVRRLAQGLLFEPALEGLEPGLHGFHIHENPNCGNTHDEDVTETARATIEPAGEAGEHWDPGAKGNHAGPWRRGHLGDLPNIQVESDGVARLPVYAPRLSLRDLEQRALIIHADADNYSDDPDDSGGSGQPIACGVWHGEGRS